ncbi:MULTISPECIES: HEAT repeat domain-containing protein [Actinoplanes]|uniref:HEAT repeat domain-containing protein n=1 Tax=Actinoplanes TaxID=1865 RepID=UPI0012FC12B3|nr:MULTISPECIES: HEAT repeat domain-containing protein [Actinoplanes]
MEAQFQFDINVYYIGGGVSPVAVAALPYLVDLAAGTAVHGRDDLIVTITRILGDAWESQQSVETLAGQVPRLLGLLDDPDVRLRCLAVELAGVGGLPHEQAEAALLRRWQVETDPAARLNLILVFGDLLARRPGDLRTLLDGLLDSEDRQVVLAAVHALARTDPDLPHRRVPELIAAVRDAGVEVWQRTGRFDGSPTAIVHHTGQLLRDGSSDREVFAAAVPFDGDRRRPA